MRILRNHYHQERYIDLEFVEETLESEKSLVLEEYRLDTNYQYINNTIGELYW